jgi:hypothetical protein
VFGDSGPLTDTGARENPVELTDDVADQVERRPGVRLDRTATGTWTESAEHHTDRGTWVRVTSRPAGRIKPQSWIGAEAASVIPDVPEPDWLQSATWRDPAGTTVWWAEGKGTCHRTGDCRHRRHPHRRCMGNITCPRLVLLDRADRGPAPRGNDTACLWAAALGVPAVADRLLAEFGDPPGRPLRADRPGSG